MSKIDTLTQDVKQLKEELMNETKKYNEEMMKQISSIFQSSDGIRKYLSSLEELMRLIVANQLLNDIDINNDDATNSKGCPQKSD